MHGVDNFAINKASYSVHGHCFKVSHVTPYSELTNDEVELEN